MRRTFLVILASGFLGSCIVPESTHIEPTYHLLSEKEVEDNNSSRNDFHFIEANESSLKNTFYLSEVGLPFYFHETKLFERQTPNEIVFRDSHRWGEEIDEGVGRVLSSVLALHMNSPFYSAFPHRKKMGSYFDIAVTLDRFERNSKDTVFLKGSWEVFTTDFEYGKVPVLNGHDEIEVPVKYSSSSTKMIKNEVHSLSQSLHIFAEKVAQSILVFLQNN